MSKIGKKLITLSDNVIAKVEDGVLVISSKDGKKVLRVKVLSSVEVKLENNQISFSITKEDSQSRANWGTMRALAQNAVTGITTDFKKVLEFQGVGFRAVVEGKTLVLNIGFSHPVKFDIPEGITIVVEKGNITISGMDKYLVGQVATKIRAFKKPNPYRGTGIKYKDEIVKKKAGKKATSGAGAAA